MRLLSRRPQIKGQRHRESPSYRNTVRLKLSEHTAAEPVFHAQPGKTAAAAVIRRVLIYFRTTVSPGI